MEYPATHATVETLPNGLTLILDPDPAAPVVSTQIWVETGSIHEDRHLGSGLSHFLEHMVFKGTRDYSADELADTVQAAGGHWNAYTSFDRNRLLHRRSLGLPPQIPQMPHRPRLLPHTPGIRIRQRTGRHPQGNRHGPRRP